MMKTILISFVSAVCAAGICFADDPGVRDSVIIETVYADIGDSAVEVRAFATCDDSVGYYNMPVKWLSPDSMITFTHVTYHNVLLQWDDLYDSLFQDLGFLCMFGWSDICGPDNPFLITYNLRMHCWTFHFAINSAAAPQIVVIDTTFDPRNGSLLFGLISGTNGFIPVFTPGLICYGTTVDISDNGQLLPTETALSQNYPNPFNAVTTLTFDLPELSYVSIAVYNILGQVTATLFEGEKQAGVHTIAFDASEYPSGVYFARLETKNATKSIKMLLLK